MVVASVVLVVELVASRAQATDPLPQAERDRMAASLEAANAADAAAQMRILAIGDSYTGGSDEGGVGPAGWPSLIGNDLAAQGYQPEVVTLAAGGSGYVAVGPSGKTLVDLANEAVGAEPYDVVIFFGSRNDTAAAAEVQAAATAAFTAVRAAWPETQLLVIGPPWVDANPPANIVDASLGVEDAATAVGAVWVDPLADGWFTGEFEALIGSDNVHPTDEGHRYMAGLIRPELEAALPAPSA